MTSHAASDRRIRLFASIPVPPLLAMAILALLLASAGRAADLPVHDGVGGDFELPSSLGRDVSLADYRGKVVLLFFGYTNCPDICPANLAHLNSLTARLGDTAAETQVLLVSVDPETDTPERMREYLARFDARYVGLTGSREQIDHVARLFMVQHQKSHGAEVTMEHNRHKPSTEKGFLYAHSQQIYLLDKQGRTRALYFVGSPVSEMEAGVRALLQEPPGADDDADTGDRPSSQPETTTPVKEEMED
jgi:protein SCO1/2